MTNILLTIIIVLMFARIVLMVYQGRRMSKNLEQRRFLLAKAAMQGFCTNTDDTYEKIAEYAVKQADALIEELKK